MVLANATPDDINNGFDMYRLETILPVKVPAVILKVVVPEVLPFSVNPPLQYMLFPLYTGDPPAPLVTKPLTVQSSARVKVPDELPT